MVAHHHRSPIKFAWRLLLYGRLALCVGRLLKAHVQCIVTQGEEEQRDARPRGTRPISRTQPTSRNRSQRSSTVAACLAATCVHGTQQCGSPVACEQGDGLLA